MSESTSEIEIRLNKVTIRLSQKIQAQIERNFLMIITSGQAIPEPTTWPPQHKARQIVINAQA